MGRRRRKDGAEDDGFGAWGGYMNAKKAKLTEQFDAALGRLVERKSDLFKGVAIYVNGYTNPGADELKLLMGQHGGAYHVYENQSGPTTHVIASNLPNVKITQPGHTPVVRPDWITDSIAQSRLLDHAKYLLHTNQSHTQPRLNFAPAKTACDPNFLSEFYDHSLLHLISTLGAEFKQLVNELRQKSSGAFPARQKLVSNASSGSAPQFPVVMHIDMDCFFVSVGLRGRPELKGRPVAVTHSKGGPSRTSVDRQAEVELYRKRQPGGPGGRLEVDIDDICSMSEVASCSYEARKCGVKNGMFFGTALKLCPQLVPIPYDFQGYREVSSLLYKTIAGYTLDIEAVSCDEMYVDVTKILQETGLGVLEWANHIRSEITEITGCPCSAGFGANRLQARLATRKAKPMGQYYLATADVEEYMRGIPLEDLPGVGGSTLQKLNRIGLKTCGDVQLSQLSLLRSELGHKLGETIYEQAKGLDRRPLSYEHERKSVSAEVNYGIRFKNHVDALTFMQSLAGEVHSRLLETKLTSRCVTLKLMVRAKEAPKETAKFLGHGFCDSLSRSATLGRPFGDSAAIFREVKALYRGLEVAPEDLRGVGIQLSRLEKAKSASSALAKFLNKACATVTSGGKGEEDVAPKSPATTKGKDPIDLDVLKELPVDLRDEVIQEYDLQSATKTETVDDVADSKRKGFADLDHDQLKELLRNWMKNERVPRSLDVEMLGDFLKALALKRKTDRLLGLVNFLHRNTDKMSCAWHDAYFKIMSYVQEGMVARYGSTLRIPRTFQCSQHSQ